MRCRVWILGLAVLLAGLVPEAQAHALLDHSIPPVGSKLKAAPGQVKLWFTAKLEPKSSRVEVLDSAGKQVDKQDLRVAADNQSLLCVSLPPLAPGKYKVRWQVRSRDGHLTKGDFTFRIAR